MPYTPRLSKTSPTEMWENVYWYSSLNVFWDSGYNTWGLPNCTCYVWGRLLELGATNLTLSTGDAGGWYGYNDGYQRGNIPQLGAVGCWYSPSSQGSGHVAIVEAIENGVVTFSNSALVRVDQVGNKNLYNNVYNNGDYFYLSYLSGSYNFGDYTFQGFIYVPITGGGMPPEPDSWYSKNERLTQSESDSNAIKFAYRMTALGFSYNCILGMLANIYHESVINPGAWENYDAVARGGYGLVQWTPYTKYSDWAGTGWENNGNKECERIDYESQNNLQWFGNDYAYLYGYPNSVPLTFAEYKTSSLNPKTLADYWLLYYEHPAESNLGGRIAEHQSLVDYYNALLGGYAPVVPPSPTSRTHSGFIYRINKRKFMRKRGIPWR